DNDVFTTDPKKFSESVGRLKAWSGGDEPESSLDALAYASRLRFRPGAVRVLLLITDASPHIPDKEIRDIPQTIDVLREQQIDQLHLIVKVRRDLYERIQRAMPKKGFTFSLDEVAKGKSFDEVLPRVSKEIAETTIGSLQSRERYSEASSGRLVFAIGLWTAFIALGLSLALVIGQKLYQRKDWRDWPGLAKALVGLGAGLLGGMLGQALFIAGGGVFGRMLGWLLLGGLVGVGMALAVPNLVWWRGLLGGVLGGIVGGLGYLFF